MSRILTHIAAVILVLHGLIHLMGTIVYLKLGVIEGLDYKTTLLGGRWDIGDGGIRIFGLLWACAAIGFILSVAAMYADMSWSQQLLGAAALFSLLITSLDYTTAYAGMALNIIILAWLWTGPYVLKWLS